MKRIPIQEITTNLGKQWILWRSGFDNFKSGFFLEEFVSVCDPAEIVNIVPGSSQNQANAEERVITGKEFLHFLSTASICILVDNSYFQFSQE